MNNLLFLLLACSEKEEAPLVEPEAPPESCEMLIFFADTDADGYGDPYNSIESCVAVDGYVENEDDCDDADPNAFPEQTWYMDIDGDGYGDSAQSLVSCAQPIGYVLDGTDCSDSDSTRHPGAVWYIDNDGDGHGFAEFTVDSCGDIAFASPLDDDCDDNNADIHPLANEICDSIDNNCNDMVDNDDPTIDIFTQIPMYRDSDLDGYGTEEYIGEFCASYVGGSPNNDDCDDSNPDINPDAFELFDDTDENCDGDSSWYSISYLQKGFTNSTVNTSFGRYFSSQDIDADGLPELLINMRTFTSDPSSDSAEEGKIIWVEGTRDPDLSDLVAESRYWIGESSDKLRGSFAGDMDGDGTPDIIMSAKEKNDYAGEVYLVSSQAASGLAVEQATWTWALGGATARFGSSFVQVGDLDSDGFDDVIVGASHLSVGGNNRGGIILLRGSDVGTVTDPTSNPFIEGNSNNDQFGLVANQAGDVNGDGSLDLIVAAIYDDISATNSGTTYLFSATDILTEGMTVDATIQFHGEAEYDKAGAQLSAAGDVNGDGYDDFLIGANDHDEYFDQDGAVYLVYGKPFDTFDASNLLVDSADAVFIGAAQNSGFADDIEGIGDVNADGMDDIAIGSFLADPTGNNRGLVIGILGGTYTGRYDVEEVAAFMLRGQANNNRIGQGIAKAGDPNGDGYDDVWIGSYGFSGYTGRILLFEGTSMP